jgi:chorismate synthase
MRFTTAGESHGRVLTALITGVPAGISIDVSLIDRDLARRQAGYGRGGRMRIETDKASILSGMRFGRTIGSPIAIAVANRDWDNWTDVMAVSGEKPDNIRETAPRPGHADLGGVLKTASDDMRDILERASARETAARVAAGGVAKAFLREFGVEVRSFVRSIGSVSSEVDIAAVDWDAVEASDVRCPDSDAAQAMRAEIDAARRDGESLGGVVVVVATGLVPGLGSYAEAERRLDARIGAAMLSIPAMKGVEIGEGFTAARSRGSEVHDEIGFDQGRGYYRKTNRAGGVEGGMTNGEDVVVTVAMKPIPTLMRPLGSIDLDTHQPIDASKERSDVCAVPAAGVVAEAELAFVLAQVMIEKFGGDAVCDIAEARARYLDRISR